MKKILFFLLLFSATSYAQWNKIVYDYGEIVSSTITLSGTSFHSYLVDGQQIQAHIYSPIVTDSEEIALVTYNSTPNTFTINSVTQNYYGGTSAVTFPDTNVIVRYEKPPAANPTASIGLSTVNGSASTFMRSDGAPALSQSITPSWTGLHTYSQAVGATQTDALLLQTTTAATVGNQKRSPAIDLQGNMWNTDSSASKQTNWRVDVLPIQGTNSTGGSALTFSSSLNGGSYTERFAVSNFSGAIRINGSAPIGILTANSSGIIAGNSTSANSVYFGTSPTTANWTSTDLTFNASNKTLFINGGIETNLVLKTGAYTATVGDRFINCDASTGAFAIALPAASSCKGLTITIKKIDGTVNAITINHAGADTIEGSTSLSLSTQYAFVNLYSDGNAIWYKQ